MPTRNSRGKLIFIFGFKALKADKPENTGEWEEENQRNCVLLLYNTQAGIEIWYNFEEFGDSIWNCA